MAAGFYGFFDTINDARVGRALIDAAAIWLQGARHEARCAGRSRSSINEEMGTLVEGQAEPSMFMMPYHRAYQDAVTQRGGPAPSARTCCSWRYVVGEIPARALEAHDEVLDHARGAHPLGAPVARIEDARIMPDVFNDAWSDNWGFVPMTEAELAKMAEDLKLLLDENIALIAEIDGRPAAVALALPNLNEAIRDLHGKLLPFGLAKLLYRLKVKRPRARVLILLGIKKEFRHKKRYGGLSAALYVEMAKRGARVGLRVGRARLDARRQPPGQPRHQDDGRRDLRTSAIASYEKCSLER